MAYVEDMAEFGMHEAKTRLSQLVERALTGEEIVITRRGKPVVKLEPVRQKVPFSELNGIFRGQIWMADDFDEFDDELAELFGMKD